MKWCVGMTLGVALAAALAGCGKSSEEDDEQIGAGSGGQAGKAGAGGGGGSAGNSGSSGSNAEAGKGGSSGASAGDSGRGGMSGGGSAGTGTGGATGGEGASAADAGADTGGGGEGGATAEPVVCDGDFTINTLGELSAFAVKRCEIVTGQLTIEGVVALANLRGLESLREVGTNLLITSNPQLESLVGLDNLRSANLVWLSFNSILNSPNGLGKLETVEQFLVTDSPNFVNFQGLYSLKTVSMSLTVENNLELQNFSGLTGLDTVTSLLARGCSSLVDFTGLERLTELALMAESNTALTSLAGLESLTSGGVQITNCGGLTDISALSGLVDAEWFTFNDTGITDLRGAENLETVEYLQFLNNAELVNVSALANLRTVGGNIHFIFNPKLQTLTGLESVETVGNGIVLQGNGALSSLNFDSLTTAGMYVQALDNPNLPQCQVDALLAQVDAVCPGSCGGNDETATCL